MQLQPRLFFQEAPDNVRQIQAGRGRTYWVIARALCRYSYYDLANVPEALREPALQVKLRQPDLYTDAGTAAVWGSSGVAVWRWDRSRAQEAMQAHNLKVSESFVLPETMFQALQVEGVRLLELSSGYEAQHWSAGVLHHSRWWAGLPALADWQGFLRDCGLSIESVEKLPAAQAIVWQDRPWRLNRQPRGGQLWEMAGYAALIFVLSLPCLWFAANTFKNWQGLQKIEAQAVQLKKTAQPVIEARAQVLRDTDRIERLVATDPWPDQLVLMAKMSEVLSRNTAWLSAWEFGQGKVKVTVDSTVALSSSALVGDLQETGLFSNASVLAGGGARQAIIEMEVVKP